MDNNIIHVALASDDNYFEGLLVTALTIASKCSRPNQLTFHILDGGITEKHYNFLKSKVSIFKCNLNRIAVNHDNRLKAFKAYHGSLMTYSRLLLPEILQDVDMIIYSDVDMLWHADIAKLWDGLDNNAIMHFVPQHPDSIPKVNAEEEEWFVRNGYKLKKERYFCAGMIVINLRKFREERLHTKILRLLEAHNGSIPNNDQTALNAFMIGRNDTCVLDSVWQIETSEARLVPKNMEFVLHYAEDAPWKSIHRIHHMLTDSFILWHISHAKIRNISTWESLRSCNSVFDIIAGRGLYLATANFSFVRMLLRLIMILKGQRDGIPCLEGFMVKTNLSHLVNRRSTSIHI